MTPDDIAAVFDTTHAEFAALSPALWRPLGQALVAHARPRPGERVLDACCGAGASALPAAQATGPTGRVDAVDLAGALLAHGRAAAAAAGLPQLRFAEADVTSWQPSDGPYDLVQIGFGMHLLPDLDAGGAHLVGLLRRGGRFAVQTWRRGALVAFAECLYDAVRRATPDPPATPGSTEAVERLHTPAGLRGWLASLGLADVQTWEIDFQPPLTPELAWGLECGTGFRGLLDPFDADTVTEIRADLLRRLDDRGLDTLDAGSLIGLGTRG
jgi:ubiquinone/menaquinone biosynthesis C-methylase UbiE